MKRILTFQEIQAVIDQEDQCGVNQLLQELLSGRERCVIGKDVEVVGDFNDQGELGEVVVRDKFEVGNHVLVNLGSDRPRAKGYLDKIDRTREKDPMGVTTISPYEWHWVSEEQLVLKCTDENRELWGGVK